MSSLLERSPVAEEPGRARPAHEFLELPELREQVFDVPVELYERLTEGLPTELLNGVIFQKVMKSALHSSQGEDLHEMLARQVQPEFVALHERPLRLSRSVPEPDVCVVRGTRAEFRRKHPTTAELVVEVAISSLTIDRAKAEIYAEGGVKEYWIVCPEKREVLIYRNLQGAKYAELKTVAFPETVESSVLPGVRVELAELFAE